MASAVMNKMEESMRKMKAKEDLKKRGRVFSCNHCRVKGEAKYLKDHLVKDHMKPEDIPFHCPICGEGFGRLSSAGTHL